MFLYSEWQFSVTRMPRPRMVWSRERGQEKSGEGGPKEAENEYDLLSMTDRGRHEASKNSMYH